MMNKIGEIFTLYLPNIITKLEKSLCILLLMFEKRFHEIHSNLTQKIAKDFSYIEKFLYPVTIVLH